MIYIHKNNKESGNDTKYNSEKAYYATSLKHLSTNKLYFLPAKSMFEQEVLYLFFQMCVLWKQLNRFRSRIVFQECGFLSNAADMMYQRVCV